MSTIDYTKYEWSGDKLLRESQIDCPYAECLPENVELISDLPCCDCISIRRTIRTNYRTISSIIEERYK